MRAAEAAVTKIVDRVPRAGMQPQLERANLYTDGAPRHHRLAGLEAWVTSAAAPFPSRAKLTFVSWLGVFPLVYIYAAIAGHVLPVSTPAVLRILLVTAVAVPTMSYLVGPWLTRLFRRWLASA